MTTSINTGTNTITIQDGCQTYVSPDFNGILEFTRISNPLSTKPTDSIIISITDSAGNSIAQRTSGTQYVATFGAMQSGTMSASPTIIGSTSAATVSLFPSNKITTAGNLKITFPSQVSFPSTS